MLFAGWEVRIVKTVIEYLNMLPEAAGRGSILKFELTVFHYTDRP